MTEIPPEDGHGPSVGQIAAGVMIGIACFRVVASLVEHILLPPLGFAIREMEFADLSIELPVEGADPVEIRYGLFLAALVSLVTLLVIVWVVRKLVGRRRMRRMDSELA